MAFHAGRTRVWKAVCEEVQNLVPPTCDVVDLGAGHCDFINQVRARLRIAIDRDAVSAAYRSDGVRFIRADVTNLPLREDSVDIAFASNLLEHLGEAQLEAFFSSLRRVLRAGGRLLLLQPNYRYCYRTYWDDYTHIKPFSHVSLVDLLCSQGFSVDICRPRFLPFSFHSRLPKSYWLTRLYLHSPFKPFGAQMLVSGTKIAAAES